MNRGRELFQYLLRAQVFWRIPALIMLLLVLMPVVVILMSWSTSQVDIWQHLVSTGLGRLLQNTAILMVGVGAVVIVLGVSLAWLTSVCDFPGRRWLDWALILPLAIPTYVVAFVALGLMSYGGPVLTMWRSVFGADAWYPDIRQPIGVVLVMSAVLYPYVYMLARSAFLQQGRNLTDAARTLGLGPWKSFFRVALPMARPAISAGMALALMEALADFGAVSVFNYDTFTTAIYKSWFGFFNLPAAAQLASVLLLFVALALFAEQKSRGLKRLHQHNPKKKSRILLTGGAKWVAFGYCFLIFFLTFVIPVTQLVIWIFHTEWSEFNARYFDLIEHTFILGLLASFIVLVFALLVSFGLRIHPSKWMGRLVQFTSLGYALPGSVLAVGVMVAFSFLDREILWPLFGSGQGVGQVLVGSVFALLMAYSIRYFSVGLGPVQTGFERIKPTYHEVAQSLGLSHAPILKRVYLPLLGPGILTSIVLVLVEVMKEMPATLLLRPFGWDTLAVRVYEMTSEGEWERAALPALTLVFVSLIPVVVTIRRSRH